MKTIRLASLTALISSVVLLDNMDAWAGPPETQQDDEMAARLRSIADDPELAADTAEFEKSHSMATKKKDSSDDAAATTQTQTQLKKRISRRTLGNTKSVHKEPRI